MRPVDYLFKHQQAELVEGGNFVKYNWTRFDAIQIIKKDRFNAYWIGFDHDDRIWHRLDEMASIRTLYSSFYSRTYTTNRVVKK
jgi:hypothetical protein